MFPFEIIFGDKLSAGLSETQTMQALICRLALNKITDRAYLEVIRSSESSSLMDRACFSNSVPKPVNLEMQESHFEKPKTSHDRQRPH